MKKILFTLTLLLFCSVAGAISITDVTLPLYDSIKAQAETNFSDLIRKKVTIEQASGIVVGQIELSGVNFPGFGRAEKVILKFNPLKYLAKKGDIVPALREIVIVNADLTLKRNQSGQWNFSYLLAPSPGQPATTPPPFRGIITLNNCRLAYSDAQGITPGSTIVTRGELVNGSIDLRNKNWIKFSLSGNVPESAACFGAINLKKGSFDLTLTGQGASLTRWGNYAIPVPGLKFQAGQGDVVIKLASPKTPGWPLSVTGSLQLKEGNLTYYNQSLSQAYGTVNINDGRIILHNFRAELFNQPISGSALISILGDKINLRLPGVRTFGGNLAGELNLTGSQIEGSINLQRINLSRVAAGAPGIEGFASGTIEVKTDTGTLQLELDQAKLIGQPVQAVAAAFRWTPQRLWLERFSAFSTTGSFFARGTISQDLYFDLETTAAGLTLRGQGPLGKMSATVNSFRGTTSWRLDQKFFAAPLRNLTASGEVVLVNGQLGEQLFDRAEGKISLGGGISRFSDTFVRHNKSQLHIFGQAGFGQPTNLQIKGDKLRLEDLPIFDVFLPPPVRQPVGDLDLLIEITGQLPANQKLDSLAPLLDLNARAKLAVKHAQFGPWPTISGEAIVSWQNHQLVAESGYIKLPDSAIYLRTVGKDSELQGTINLARLNPFLEAERITLGGTMGLALKSRGPFPSNNFSAAFWLDHPRYNEIFFDQISGACQLNNNTLKTVNQLSLLDGVNQYNISGQISQLNTAPTLALKIDTAKANLAKAYILGLKIQGEIAARTAAQTPAATLSKIHLSLATNQQLPLFQPATIGSSILGDWQKIARAAQKRLAKSPVESLAGELAATIQLSGPISAPLINYSAQVGNGAWRNFTFKNLSLKGAFQGTTLQITSASLNKEDGVANLTGQITFPDDLTLSLETNNFPLSALNTFFPADRFAGGINGRLKISGKLADPLISAEAQGNEVTICDAKFDKVYVKFFKDEEQIALPSLWLQEGKHLSQASFVLKQNDQIEGSISFEGNAIALANLLNDEYSWQQGDSLIRGTISGSLAQPEINGKLFLNNASISLRNLDSSLTNLQGSATINRNRLVVRRLTGYWQGTTTRQIPNFVGLAGEIDLSNALAPSPSLGLNLAFTPQRYYLAMPRLYTGLLTFNQLSLVGPLSLDYSKAPKLTGEILVEDAVINLGSGGGNGGQLLPLGLDLNVTLGKNVYIVMGDVNTLNLSNILLNLEVAGSNLKITQSLREPTLLGKVLLKRGTVNIFNREFVLLNTEQQKSYYQYDAEAIQENNAVFNGEVGPSGALPNIKLTASVVVDNTEIDATGKEIKVPVTILARLKGVLGAKEETRGIKIALTGFREDKTTSPPQFVQTTFSENDLRVMLLPDFIKSLAGLNQKNASTSNASTNAVVADYLTSRVQTVLFRGLQREIEQALGLESLTLEYNFGPKIREAMGINDPISQITEKPTWTVGFVKGFFDRLYIDVRYSQGANGSTTGSNTNYFNYQLTYKLNPTWSIIYYREPINVSDIAAGYQKMTLKAGYSLW